MFSYSKWLETPLHVRAKIAEQFGVPKIRSTHVSNNVVVDDGYNVKDIERVVSVENLQEFLSTNESDLEVLFQRLIDKMEGKEPQVAVLTEDEADKFKKEYEERKEDTKDEGTAPKGNVQPARSGKKA